MSYLTVNDVMEILGVGQSKAYQVIRYLNKELKSKGYITVAGKISRKFFYEKYYCEAS
ncbi:transcriptional regulator [Vallitalea pronyensis]|uniref:Transcriptional regulator n=1 Tax=Vallitalea pronyensis TaxID=1348613 RepID=A0A8J8MJN3_9FIRM|nr:transcriptional regulator [Vallitalea pronyensis]QUI22731.1 transcriptional regulator [Vallitalea pronyensis]